jgi:hypothetical protein
LAKEKRPFHEWLVERRNGALNVELSEGLAKLAESVSATQKPGYITLKITVKPTGSEPPTVSVSDALLVKTPETHTEHIYYVDTSGSLVRSDPNQLSLEDLLEASPSSADLKEV